MVAGAVLELATVAGDPDGIAFAINDRGQAVGASGNCGPFNAIEQNNLTPLHAVLWRDGKAITWVTWAETVGLPEFMQRLKDGGQVVGTLEPAAQRRPWYSASTRLNSGLSMPWVSSFQCTGLFHPIERYQRLLRWLDRSR